MLPSRLAGAPAALALLCAPTAAQAQSCSLLRIQRDQVVRSFLQIAADYPRTHGMLALCFASQTSQREARACADDTLRVACAFMGSGDCNNLLARWGDAVFAMDRVERAMRQSGCAS